jgi:alcohol dehydrogenase (cytochrome c)
MTRISTILLTLLVIFASIGASNATVVGNSNYNPTGDVNYHGNDKNSQNTVNKNVITPLAVISTDKNWGSINYDPEMSRNSGQITINNTNVNKLVKKWTFNTSVWVENPPLIVGQTAYVQNNAMQVFALNLLTGQLNWKYDPIVANHTASHGMRYQDGIIYAPTGSNGTVLALNGTNGNLIWKSPLIDSQNGYYNPSVPIIWNNYVIVGGGGGDIAPLKGSITALNKTTGNIIWQITTCIGPWVQGSNASLNGGGAVWSGGAVDQNKGIIYLPVGNPSPDFNASTRNDNTSYTNCMIAVNITNGHIIWSTPFIQVGTVLNVTLPDTHDWDISWGSQFITSGTNKLVIGHDKYGDVMAMNATNGKPLWWINLHSLYNGTVHTIFNNYCAHDNHTIYIQNSPSSGKGTIAAFDLFTGILKWKYITKPVISSPLVTNSILFAANNSTIMALNKKNGQLLWQYNIGQQIGQGGQSIGQGMLLVTTSNGQIVAFGLDPIKQSPIKIQTSPIKNQTSPIINNTSPANSNYNSKWINTIHNTSGNDPTIPLQKTGIPVLPAIFGLLIISGGIIERKLRK